MCYSGGPFVFGEEGLFTGILPNQCFLDYVSVQIVDIFCAVETSVPCRRGICLKKLVQICQALSDWTSVIKFMYCNTVTNEN